MVAAIDIKAFGTSEHIGREVSFEEAFMDTFDNVVTLPGEKEPFDSWCEWFNVDLLKVGREGDMMLGLLAFCPFFQQPGIRLEARYDINVYLFGSEEAYLDALSK